MGLFQSKTEQDSTCTSLKLEAQKVKEFSGHMMSGNVGRAKPSVHWMEAGMKGFWLIQDMQRTTQE